MPVRFDDRPNTAVAYILLTVGALGWFWAVRHDPFFWDTVQLGSKHAHFFYENGLQWLPLPPAIDSGHPPLLGYYLAVCWTLFGKTLPVSHAAVWPFAWGTAVLLWRLGGRLATQRWQGWLVATVWLDPVVAGQMALISPDGLLIFGCLLFLDGHFAQQNQWTHGHKRQMLAVVLLSLVSTRGMMTVAALGCWQLCLFWQKRMHHVPASPHVKWVWQRMTVFGPGTLLALAFLCWHHHTTGWTGFHPDSPWATAFQPTTTLLGGVRNTAILVWRWLDFGRFLLWGLAGVLFWQNRQSGPLSDTWLLLGCMLLFLSPTALLYQNLSAHRYFLPVFLALHILVFQGIAQSAWPMRMRYAVFAALLLAMFTGNRWIYPRGISMDWDSTLAHLPYHCLRAESVAWLREQNIPIAAVGSAFPNLNTGEHLLLNGEAAAFAPISLSRNRYVLTSNVFNDLNASDYQNLMGRARVVWFKKQAGVEVMVWQIIDKLD